MPALSKWMIGYGALLIACDLLDLYAPSQIALAGRTLISGWAGGLLMIAAGLVAAQRRRSLRLTGSYVGVILPAALALIFGWSALEAHRADRAGWPTSSLGILAGLSALIVIILLKVWPREGIATRGYAVTTPIPKQSAPAATRADIPARVTQSETR